MDTNKLAQVTIKKCFKPSLMLTNWILEGKYTLESTDPRKSKIRAHLRLQFCVEWVENVLLIYYASSDLLVCLHWKLVCLHPRFTAFLDSNLHSWLAIVTENELGLAFPPRNLPKKFRPDPSMFYLVIVVTNRQTDRLTNASDYIIPRESFCGDNQ